MSFLSHGSRLLGQAVPAATASPPHDGGFSWPTEQGTLRYSASLSEAANFGYEGRGTTSSTNLAGNFGYVSQSVRMPFNVTDSIGYISNTNGQASSFFERLAATQTILSGRWTVAVSDSLSYLPETPATGLSGIPGVGDLSGTTGTANSASQSVLTGYATRLDNSVSGNVTRTLTGKTSLSGSSSCEIQRFLNSSSGLDSNQASGTIGTNHRIDARNNAGVNYSYSHFTYAATESSFSSQVASFEYNRQWTRKVSMSGSIGPQWTNVSGSSFDGSTKLNYAAGFHLTYAGKSSSSSLNYTRSNNTGSGVSLGARTDSVSVSGSRRVGYSLQLAGSLSFARSANLSPLVASSLTTQSLIMSVQGSRALSRSLFAFVSYTDERQSFQGTASALSPFSGNYQILSVGITYSPAQIRIGRK
jgi:hypothetical protein